MKAAVETLVTDSETRSTLKIPRYPRSWYRLGNSSELPLGSTKPVGYSLMGRELVAFRTSDQRVHVLDGRCSHLGAHLKYGEVANDKLRCPLHGWCYDRNGSCVEIPIQKEIPEFAGQKCYPAVEQFGEIFFFLDQEQRFSFPRFESAPFEDLHPARPFGLVLEAPYYMITGNGFDIQHFRQSHDRVLLSEPVVDHPSEDAIRVTMRLGVVGDSFSDRITRRFGGPELTFSYTCWGGTLGFIEAKFAQAHSFGFVSVIPLSATSSYYSNTVFVRRQRAIPRRFLNVVNAELRRLIIWHFLKVDIDRIKGTYAAVDRCIESDAVFLQYCNWVQRFN